MAYLQHTSWKDRPGAVIGVVVVHAAVGYALVTGLDFEQIVNSVKNPEAVDVVVPLPPAPPPPPPKAEVVPERAPIDPPMMAPAPPLDISPQRPAVETSPLIVPVPEVVPRIIPGPVPQDTPSPRPSFAPQGAKPRGNPGDWVTVNDYRSSWINREMTGTARFRLDIGANGRVDGCTITASSGHPELDKATCALVTQRARFDPAKDSTGAKVGGSYSNSVRWELPQ